MPRKYELGRRAKHQAETRKRIVEATVALHEEFGVARTTVSDIARQAGVERATVYRHFPDERSLLAACTGHFYSRHPLPDAAGWQDVSDPEARLTIALKAIYAFHRRTERMTDRGERDLPIVPALRDVLAPAFAHWDLVRNTLVAGWPATETQSPIVAAAIGHAISFSTWRSLVREQGLDDAQAVAVMSTMVREVAGRD